MTSPEQPLARGAVSDDDSFDRQPNYLVRRGIAVAGVVAAIAAGAIFVGSLLGGDDDSTETGAANADWNTIVLIDARTGQVVLRDAQGEEQSRFASGVATPTDAMAVGPTMFVTSAEQVAVVNLLDETTETIELDAGTTGVAMPAGSALTMLTTTVGGDRAVFVHGPSGDVLDTGDFASIAGAKYDVTTTVATPSGRDVLVTDAGNFQSVLFSFDRDEPSYFPGRGLAVDDKFVVTTQNVGSEASIAVFNHDGSSVTATRAPSVRAAMVADGSVILVTVDGEILDLSTAKGTTSPLDTLAIGTIQTGYVSPDGDRLTVVGDGGSAILDDAGAVLGTFAGMVPLDVGIDETAPRTSSCVAFTNDGDSGLVIASLDDAAIVAEATATAPMLPTVDGCTVVATSASGVSVIASSGVVDHDAAGDLVALAPDGSNAVVESAAGRLLLTDLTASPNEQPVAAVPGTDATTTASGAVDLGPASRLVLFTQR